MRSTPRCLLPGRRGGGASHCVWSCAAIHPTPGHACPVRPHVLQGLYGGIPAAVCCECCLTPLERGAVVLLAALRCGRCSTVHARLYHAGLQECGAEVKLTITNDRLDTLGGKATFMSKALQQLQHSTQSRRGAAPRS